jgi:hypothetical protein
MSGITEAEFYTPAEVLVPMLSVEVLAIVMFAPTMPAAFAAGTALPSMPNAITFVTVFTAVGRVFAD